MAPGRCSSSNSSRGRTSTSCAPASASRRTSSRVICIAPIFHLPAQGKVNGNFPAAGTGDVAAVAGVTGAAGQLARRLAGEYLIALGGGRASLLRKRPRSLRCPPDDRYRGGQEPGASKVAAARWDQLLARGLAVRWAFAVAGRSRAAGGAPAAMIEQ